VLELLDSLSSSALPPVEETPAAERILIQDWRPLSESLEWRVSEASWRKTGLDLFVRGDVPYVVNNVAWIAESLAAVVLQSLDEIRPALDRIWILELGAGLGLFARQFLDAFRDLCLAGKRDEYDRLTYWVTDGSRRTVKRWIEADIFREHLERVEIGTCDALDPRTVSLEGGATGRIFELPRGSCHLVIANYLFDSLPATILRREEHSELHEMQVRTYLEPGMQIPHLPHLHVDEIKRLVETLETASDERLTPSRTPDGEPSPHEILARVLPYCSFELNYRPRTGPRPWRESDLPGPIVDRVVLNYGAIECLTRVSELLGDQGLIFYRDLGAGSSESSAQLPYSARFGPTVVATVNFSLLDGWLSSRGFRVVSPANDETRAIRTRLALRGPFPAAEREFVDRFADDRYGKAELAAAEAMRHVNSGQFRLALAAYRRALEQSPDDWNLLGQTAQFLTQQMLSPSEALELVEQALQINPAFSAFLWNTRGNCHYVLGDIEGAHRDYLRASEIDARDAQAHLNLAYTRASFGELEDALLEIALGLACDSAGYFEASLLAKQKEILLRLEQRRRHEDARASARRDTFTSQV
jgi:Tfp pilus assembly protein PilF